MRCEGTNLVAFREQKTKEVDVDASIIALEVLSLAWFSLPNAITSLSDANDQATFSQQLQAARSPHKEGPPRTTMWQAMKTCQTCVSYALAQT